LRQGEVREGTAHRHALEADFAGDGALRIEVALRSEAALRAAKARHPAGDLTRGRGIGGAVKRGGADGR
jgi:hypothetical protein